MINIPYEQKNLTTTQVKVSPNNIEISGTNSMHVLILVGLVTIIVVAVVIYCLGVKKAKAKGRNIQTITFSPILSPNNVISLGIAGSEVQECPHLIRPEPKLCLEPLAGRILQCQKESPEPKK